jgi:hypothetical protein
MAMSEPSASPGAEGTRRAAAVVDLGLKACEAYGREDLAERLTVARGTLRDPGIHIVVAGEFKKGKSSLVNAMLGAVVCPVDDDIATAVPTYLRYGQQVEAELLLAGETVRRRPIPIEDVRRYVVLEGGADPGEVVGVEVRLPRSLLSSGLVVVDTPGVGGLGSAHATASLAAISMADAVLFVTDASQELTRAELDFLQQAGQLCETVVCVVTKTDFFPAWRTIRDLNVRHLDQVGEVRVLAVSSALRTQAVKTNDAALNTESGFPAVIEFVSGRVAGGGVNRVSAAAAAEVGAVCRQIEAQFEAEQSALSDPRTAARVVAQLTATKERADALRSAASRWQSTLGDGIADLTSNVDHDLRGRIRQVINEADAAIEEADPVDTWQQIEVWLQARVSQEVLINYTLLRQNAGELSERVAHHFRSASGEVFDQLEVYNPGSILGQAQVDPSIEMERFDASRQLTSMLRQSYGGILMFTMLPNLLMSAVGSGAASLGLGGAAVVGGLSMTPLMPVFVGVGLLLGRRGLQEEKKRHLTQRRGQAKNAVRKYCDDVSFAVGKDSRDTVRRIQRQLRDHYSTRAEELNRSNAEALRSAQAAAQQSEAERQARLRDLAAELARLAELRQRASAVQQ